MRPRNLPTPVQTFALHRAIAYKEPGNGRTVRLNSPHRQHERIPFLSTASFRCVRVSICLLYDHRLHQTSTLHQSTSPSGYRRPLLRQRSTPNIRYHRLPTQVPEPVPVSSLPPPATRIGFEKLAPRSARAAQPEWPVIFRPRGVNLFHRLSIARSRLPLCQISLLIRPLPSPPIEFERLRRRAKARATIAGAREERFRRHASRRKKRSPAKEYTHHAGLADEITSRGNHEKTSGLRETFTWLSYAAVFRLVRRFEKIYPCCR